MTAKHVENPTPTGIAPGTTRDVRRHRRNLDCAGQPDLANAE
jgi:hypothetical protein